MTTHTFGNGTWPISHREPALRRRAEYAILVFSTRPAYQLVERSTTSPCNRCLARPFNLSEGEIDERVGQPLVE